MLVQANAAEGTPAISGGARRPRTQTFTLLERHTPHTHSIRRCFYLHAHRTHASMAATTAKMIRKGLPPKRERGGGATPHGWAHTQSFGLLRSLCGTSTQ
jgi:hypothetical protein